LEESLVLTFRVGLEDEDDLTGMLLVAVDVQGTEERADGMLDVYISAEDWTEELQQRISEFSLDRKSVELVEVKPLEVKDWNAEWEASIEPVKVTEQVVITPSWKLEQSKELRAKYTIVIDPKMSFGTGHHETTRLCMRAIETLDVAERTVLDIGTGSGVLAFYALMRGATRAVAIDTDQWSIDNVKENQELNEIGDEIFDLRKGELEQSVRKDEVFSLVLANIHRNVLMAISAGIADRITPNGHIILSGLLIYDANDVRVEYERAGFLFIQQLQENEWVAIVMQKG
jgi:ribosomal protein L11 methyltransferase